LTHLVSSRRFYGHCRPQGSASRTNGSARAQLGRHVTPDDVVIICPAMRMVFIIES